MAARHRSRQRALQVLYQWDMNKGPVEDAISSFYDTVNSEEGEEQTGRDEGDRERAEREPEGTPAALGRQQRTEGNHRAEADGA